jgi:SMODS and SLOG-associating 2TM effector domain 2
VPPPAALGWGPGSAKGSLAALFKRASDCAQCAIEWYLKAKRPKQASARAVRGGSILLAALAGILPMLSQMPGSSIAPIWASVALALATAFVLLDRFFGFSSAWMRYITTELHLQQMLDEFQFD